MSNVYGREVGSAKGAFWGVFALLALALAFFAILRAYPVAPLPEEPRHADADKAQQVVQKQDNTDGSGEFEKKLGINVSYDAIRHLLITQPAARQLQLLRDGDSFVEFVQQEIRHQSLLAMAVQQGVHESARARFMTERAVAEVLRKMYSDQYLSSRIDGDWPNDEQLRQTYEESPDSYVLPRRVHLWQVFLPAPDGISDEILQQQENAAQSIYLDLLAAKTSFTDAAARFSKHPNSRGKGGYMGLVEVKVLRPQFREAIAGLEEDSISQPIRDEDGFHILRRGAYREAYPLSFEEAKPAIRTQMRQELAQRLRLQLLTAALENNPYELESSKVKDWWQKLRQEALAQVQDKAGKEASGESDVQDLEEGEEAGEMLGGESNDSAGAAAGTGDGV
ncbi:MAG: peptidylprolyl isomerase [Candidatus Porifericomitaceae bacterium WSBS_2022_MAG_OTU9]